MNRSPVVAIGVGRGGVGGDNSARLASDDSATAECFSERRESYKDLRDGLNAISLR
jgi:hypothetical protein